MIQFFCYKSTGGYGAGDGCPMLKARFRVNVHSWGGAISYKSIGSYAKDSDGMNTDATEANQNDCGWVQAIHGDWQLAASSIEADANY